MTASHDTADGRLIVDLDAIAANHALLASRAAPAICAAVVKADGYGLGAVPVSRRLAAEGCRHFFVALLDEALALRPALPADALIHVLNGLPAGAEQACAEAGIIPVLNTRGQVDRWAALADALGRRLDAVLQVDSGMSRLGVSFDDARAIAQDAGFADRIGLTMIMSHLACADDPADPANEDQRRQFCLIADMFPGLRRSLSGSGGIFVGAGFAFDLVRPGIALYGGAPNVGRNPMRAVVRLQARVVQLRTVPAGTGVGYGLAFRPGVESRLATIGVGYADGWPRALGNRGAAWFDGVRLPIAGRVSMDSMVLDIGGVPEGALAEGDWVDLICDAQPVDAVAAQAGTIAYELLTRLGARLQRVYRSATGEGDG